MNEMLSTPDLRYVPEMPATMWAKVGVTVMAAVDTCEGKTPYSRRRLISTIAHHTAWCMKAGYSLNAEELFSRELVDSSITFAFKHLSPGSLSTIRAQLLRVGEVMAPQESAHRLKALPASGTSVPYTPKEVASLYGWATGQPSERRRNSSRALLALGLGAGLSSGEILAARREHVSVDMHGVRIQTQKSRPRSVQMLSEWEETLLSSIEELSPEAYLFRPGPRAEHLNSITNFVAQSRGIEIKPLGQRMRATWIVTHLNAATPVRVLMEAAGVESLEAFTRYVRFLDPVKLKKARRLLRLARQPSLNSDGQP